MSYQLPEMCFSAPSQDPAQLPAPQIHPTPPRTRNLTPTVPIYTPSHHDDGLLPPKPTYLHPNNTLDDETAPIFPNLSIINPNRLPQDSQPIETNPNNPDTQFLNAAYTNYAEEQARQFRQQNFIFHEDVPLPLRVKPSLVQETGTKHQQQRITAWPFQLPELKKPQPVWSSQLHTTTNNKMSHAISIPSSLRTASSSASVSKVETQHQARKERWWTSARDCFRNRQRVQCGSKTGVFVLLSLLAVLVVGITPVVIEAAVQRRYRELGEAES